MPELCGEDLKISSFGLVPWDPPSSGLPPSPHRGDPQRPSLCHDGAEKRVSFCTNSLGWFGEERMFGAWMNQELGG